MKHTRSIYLPGPAGHPAMFPMPPNGAQLRAHQLLGQDGQVLAALIGWAIDEAYFLPLAENFTECVKEEITADMVPDRPLEGAHAISLHLEGGGQA